MLSGDPREGRKRRLPSHEYSIRLIENLKDADPRADIAYVLMARVGGWLIELSRWNVSIRGTQIGVEIWSEGYLRTEAARRSRRSNESGDDEAISSARTTSMAVIWITQK